MKICLLFFATILILSLTVITEAQIILAPGEDKVFTQLPATGGNNGDNGNITFNLNSEYDVSNKTIKAQANGRVLPSVSIGRGIAYASIHYEFQIMETPETQNNTVGAWISWDVLWQGYAFVLSAPLSNAIATRPLSFL